MRVTNAIEWMMDEGWMVVLGMAFLFLLAYTASTAIAGTKEVTIDGKHFACTATEPFGIEARCTQYTWVKGVR